MNLETGIEGYSDGDVDTNRSSNDTLHSMIDKRYSRRQTLLGGMSATAMAFLGTSMLSACGDDAMANSGPTVSAGGNATTSSGRAVTLAGTASDSDGIGGVTWTQVSGPQVTLTGANTANASFIAPSVATATELKFRHTGVDSLGAVSAAETTVTVQPATLGFTAVPKNLNDVVTVPAGYTVSVLYRTGDPIAAGVPAYANDGSDTDFAKRAGDQHDGMTYFGLSATGTPDENSSTRGLLAINHENILPRYLHANGPTSTANSRPYDEVIKEIEAHGVSIVETARAADGTWSYVQDSALNRRITPLTEMTIHGPARNNALMKTLYSPDGTKTRGTINNCANGYTPWHTYLTAEENWAGYYRRDASDIAARAGTKENTSLARYGKGSERIGNNSWTLATSPTAGDTSIDKFDMTLDPTKPADGTGDFRYEINQVGWIVEIDPYDPASIPRKRTALGRMNHEGAWPGRFVGGVKPAWYTGDDSGGEYLYKFVSDAAWAPADANSSNRLAMGDKYLDEGTLYVAKFNADGTGEWKPLVFGQNGLTAANATYPFADQGDVLINTRLAADVMGATKMDRPEWTATNPATGEVYLTLTNNSGRTPATTEAANPRAYVDPKDGGGQSKGNANGHVLRLRETGDTTEATTFAWDAYAYGAGVDLDPVNINLSGLDDTNDFSSPDGAWFGRASNASGLVNPLLWLQTDDGAYTDVTNCMMLCGQPGTVGDGGTKTITNTMEGATGTQTARVGAQPGAKLRRFMVGPKQCEITGIDSTPDGRTLFVNIQHPGSGGTAAAPTSNWPQSQSGSATGRPRSATIVVTKDDGGVVGL